MNLLVCGAHLFCVFLTAASACGCGESVPGRISNSSLELSREVLNETTVGGVYVDPGEVLEWSDVFGALENGSLGNETAIKVGVILETGAGSLFDFAKIMPAVDMAVAVVNRHVLGPLGRRLEVVPRVYAQRCGAENASGAASQLIFRDGVAAVIGPACSPALEHVARFTSFLDVPTVTGLGDHRSFLDKSQYKTLTRFAYCQCRLRQVFNKLFDHFNWTRVAIIYDADEYFSANVGESLDHGFRSSTGIQRTIDRVYTIPFEGLRDFTYAEMLLRASEEARGIGGTPARPQPAFTPLSPVSVIILSVGGDVLRSFLLTAHDLGMINGEWVFVDLELFPSYAWGDKSWRRGDANDTKARTAYEALLRVSLLEPRSQLYAAFEAEVRRRSRRDYNFNFPADEKVSPIL